MDEQTARELVASYLKGKGRRPVVQRGAGPDILLDGIALEVKGSRFDPGTALEQFTRYAFTYRDLEIALPADAVDLRLLTQLRALEASIRFRDFLRERQICFYVLDADESGISRVLEFPSMKAISEFVGNQIETEVSSGAQAGDEAVEAVYGALLDIDSCVVKVIQRQVRAVGMVVEREK